MNVVIAANVMSISHKYVGLRDVGTASTVCLRTVNGSVCIGSFENFIVWLSKRLERVTSLQWQEAHHTLLSICFVF